MSSKKLSLSSPAVKDRLRKYDTYTHKPSKSSRQHIARNHVEAVSRNDGSAQARLKKQQSPQVIHKAAQIAGLPYGQTIRSSHYRVTQKSLNSLALRSVANSKEHQNKDGAISQQFTDEQTVQYAEVKSKFSRLQKAMYVFGALVFVFSAFTSLQTIMTNKEAKDQIATLGVRTDEQGVSEGSGDEPSEGSVSEQALRAFKPVNPEDPRYLRIPSLGVLARVKNLGVDSKGAVDAPWNINDAGWYNGSARPGARTGSSLILGHVSGWTAPGIFKNLKNLKNGTQFEIEKGTGEKVKYEVVRSEDLPVSEVNMGKILGTEEAGKHDLKMMTCSGKYNKETKTYENRHIVYAKQV